MCFTRSRSTRLWECFLIDRMYEQPFSILYSSKGAFSALSLILPFPLLLRLSQSIQHARNLGSSMPELQPAQPGKAMKRNQPPRPALLSFIPSVNHEVYKTQPLSSCRIRSRLFPSHSSPRGIDIKYVAPAGPQTCRDDYAMLLNRRSEKIQTAGAILAAGTICKRAELGV